MFKAQGSGNASVRRGGCRDQGQAVSWPPVLQEGSYFGTAARSFSTRLFRIWPGRGVGGILCGMRVKTSVTIDEKVLRAIDRATSRHRSRSRVIEDAAREFLARRSRAAREARDLEILNDTADALNREMDDVLTYQADV